MKGNGPVDQGDRAGRAAGADAAVDVLVELARGYAALLAARLGADLQSVVLFGSVARGEAQANSDIDVLVIARNLPESRAARQRLSMEVEDVLGPRLEELRRAGRFVEFSPILKTPDEASKVCPLYLDMTEDAIVLCDPDDFFGRIIERLRRRLSDYGARRVRVGKMRYWDLKPDYRWGEVISLD